MDPPSLLLLGGSAVSIFQSEVGAKDPLPGQGRRPGGMQARCHPPSAGSKAENQRLVRRSILERSGARSSSRTIPRASSKIQNSHACPVQKSSGKTYARCSPERDRTHRGGRRPEIMMFLHQQSAGSLSAEAGLGGPVDLTHGLPPPWASGFRKGRVLFRAARLTVDGDSSVEARGGGGK